MRLWLVYGRLKRARVAGSRQLTLSAHSLEQRFLAAHEAAAWAALASAAHERVADLASSTNRTDPPASPRVCRHTDLLDQLA